MTFYDIVINLLNNVGFFNIILPFLLVYAIIYGILAKYKILGDPYKEDNEGKATRSIISMISAATGFLVIGATNFILSIKTLIPYISLFILTIFFLLLAIAPFLSSGGELKIEGKTRTILISVAIVIFFIVVVSSLGLFSYLIGISNYLSSQSTILSQILYTVIILGVLLGIIYWVTRPAKSERTQQSK